MKFLVPVAKTGKYIIFRGVANQNPFRPTNIKNEGKIPCEGLKQLMRVCGGYNMFYAGSSLAQGCSTTEYIYNIRVSCFELKLSPLRDTLMCNEGIVRSELVSPRSISPEINGRQSPLLANRRRPRTSFGAWISRRLYNWIVNCVFVWLHNA